MKNIAGQENTPEFQVEEKTDRAFEQKVWRRLLFLQCIICIPIFFLLFWLLNTVIPHMFPGSEDFLTISISIFMWGGQWILQIFISFVFIFGFNTLKFGFIGFFGVTENKIHGRINPLFQVSSIQAGMRYGCILLLFLPIQFWCVIGPFIRYLPFTNPVIHPSSYCGMALLLFTYGFIVALISSYIYSSDNVKRIFIELKQKPKTDSLNIAIMNPNEKNSENTNIGLILKRWMKLSGYAFPLSLGILIGSAILLGIQLSPVSPSMTPGFNQDSGFIFPISFFLGNGPLWGVVFMLFAGYLALMTSASYLLLEPINSKENILCGFLFSLLYCMVLLSPIPPDGMKSVLMMQGIIHPWYFSAIDFLFLVSIISLILGFGMNFIDKWLKKSSPIESTHAPDLLED